MTMPLISLQESDEIVLDVTVPSSSLLCRGVPFAGARLVLDALENSLQQSLCVNTFLGW